MNIRSDSELVRLFRGAVQMKADMMAEGASPHEIADAFRRSIKAILRPIPESEWPHWAFVPRCIHCDGYGFIVTPVQSRMGYETTEARYCTCEKGQRFTQKAAAVADFTAAGKAPPKPKGFSKWNG